MIKIKQIKITRDNFEEQVEFFKGSSFIPKKDSYNNIFYETVEGYIGRVPWYNDIAIKIEDDGEIIIVDNHIFNYIEYHFNNDKNIEECKLIIEKIKKEIDSLNDLRVASNEIILGDVVKLKSGSMSMTVKDIIDDNTTCEYYLDGEFKTATFKKHQLKLER